MFKFKRVVFWLGIILIMFGGEAIVSGESTPTAIEYNLKAGEIVTKTFTLSQDTQVRYSFTASFQNDGYIKINGPSGQIYYRDTYTKNPYSGSFSGVKGGTYTVEVYGGYYSDSEDEYYGDIDLTIKYYELNVNTYMYDFKLSGPKYSDSNCSQTYNLYLPTDSLTTGCYGSNSSKNFNSSSDISLINYPVQIWWSVTMSNKKEHGNTSPEFKITLEDESGAQTVKKNVTGYTSASGNFELPKNNKMLIYAKTGDTYNTNSWGSKTHYSYVVDYKICYKLDDVAPGTPGKAEPVEGYYDSENEKYYTKSDADGCIALTWDQIADDGPSFNGVQTLSGISGYKIKVNGAEIEPEYILESEDGKVTADVKSQYFSSYENSVQLQAYDVAGNYGSWGESSVMISDDDPPEGPANLTCANSSADPLIWTWEAASDALSGLKQYKIVVTDQTTGATFIEDTVAADAVSYSCSGLTDLTTYQITVTAEDNAGNLSEPASNTVTVVRSAPGVTLPAYPIKFNKGVLKFTWDPISVADNILFQEYQVAITETSETPASDQIIFSTDAINTTTCSYNCSSRKTWYLWVRAVLQSDIQGSWTMAGPFPDFTIDGPENGQVIDEAAFAITVSPWTAGKDLRYKVSYQAETEVLETGAAVAGTATSIVLPFEANWKWWLEVAEYQDGSKVTDSVVVTEAFNLRYDLNNSDTTSRGTLYEDEIWWSGIHYITGDVIVPEGLTLTIEPDTQVISLTDGSKPALIIRGEMTSGTGSSFTASTGTTGDWRGIIVEGMAAMEGATISQAERGLTALNGASVTLTDCVFSLNTVGIHAYNANPTVGGCKFLNNIEYGIKEDEGGRPAVTDSMFTGNGIDYYRETLTEITMDELNGIEGNSGNQEGN